MPRPGARRPSLAPQGSKPAGEQRAAAAERRRFAGELRAALGEAGFVVHFQPRVVLSSGEISGCEALLRWPHRRRGLISPAVFIPVAEETGLINDLGGWVLEAACQEAAGWPQSVTISVNVSARQLHEGVLIGQVARALEYSGLAPERLELELTESMLINLDEDVLMLLGAVRDRGVGLALDDFGTGFASLGMLRQLPLTVMKLDRSLVRNLPDHAEDTQIVRAVVATGRALGLVVVGEGIETEGQRDFLAAIETDEGQGYLFSRPVPAATLRPQLEEPGPHRLRPTGAIALP